VFPLMTYSAGGLIGLAVLIVVRSEARRARAEEARRRAAHARHMEWVRDQYLAMVRRSRDYHAGMSGGVN
jgi:hypothetical protein